MGKKIVEAKKSDLEKLDALIKGKGLSIKQVEELVSGREKKFRPKITQPRTKATFRFGIVSDTHLVSKACHLLALHEFYARCKEEGVAEVVHTGDLADGSGSVYRGQINELMCFGLDEHLDFLVKHYPQVEGITTYCISGNHDENYKIAYGTEILHALSQRRPDIKYLGMYDATVQLNGIYIGLHHGAGGVPYAISYHMQKFVEKIGAGQKPNIYILGHYHGAFYMFYRNIHCFLPGSWQKPTDFSVRYGFPNMMGGWIVEVDVADDRKNSITRIKSEFIPYY